MKIKLKFYLFSLSLLVPIVSQADIPSHITENFAATKISLNSITIDTPELVENGSQVSIKIHKLKQIPTGTFVTEIFFFNPFHHKTVARYKLGQQTLATGLIFRIRMRAIGKV